GRASVDRMGSPVVAGSEPGDWEHDHAFAAPALQLDVPREKPGEQAATAAPAVVRDGHRGGRHGGGGCSSSPRARTHRAPPVGRVHGTDPVRLLGFPNYSGVSTLMSRGLGWAERERGARRIPPCGLQDGATWVAYTRSANGRGRRTASGGDDVSTDH